MAKAPARKQPPILKASSGSASSSKSLMWMMAALFAGLALLTMAGLFVASRAVRSMGLSAASAKDSFHTAGGTFRLEKEAEVGLALPVYPRASLIVPDEASAAAAIKEAQKGIDVSAYQSSDSRDFVDGWYAKHLSPEFVRHDAANKPAEWIYRDAHVADDDILFVAERQEKARVVALSMDPRGTKVSLIRLDRPASASKRIADPSRTPVNPAPAAEPAAASTQATQ